MKRKIKFLDLGAVNEPLMEQLVEAASGVVRSGWYINGENVKALEQELAQYCSTECAVAVSNGLDALRLIIRAYIELGAMQPGDEVIVPANTYIATVLAVTDNGLVPVLVEPDLVTMNLDPSLIERYITKRTQAIMPVHLYGTPCWSSQINELAQRYGLKIIEDNAQAIGAQAAVAGLNGTRVTGSLGHAAGLSFYPTKNLGALGDAGAVTTNDKELASVVRALANYGSDYRYHNVYCGLNCRMDEIQAAMLRVKLKHVDEENLRRANMAATYDTLINNPQVVKPAILPGCKQVWHQYVLRVEERDTFRAYLAENGIETDVLYPTPPHLQPCYIAQYGGASLPRTLALAGSVVSLPISVNVKEDEIQYICEIINKFHLK